MRVGLLCFIRFNDRSVSNIRFHSSTYYSVYSLSLFTSLYHFIPRYYVSLTPHLRVPERLHWGHHSRLTPQFPVVPPRSVWSSGVVSRRNDSSSNSSLLSFRLRSPAFHCVRGYPAKLLKHLLSDDLLTLPNNPCSVKKIRVL